MDLRDPSRLTVHEFLLTPVIAKPLA
jgi:hypothetical protein